MVSLGWRPDEVLSLTGEVELVSVCSVSTPCLLFVFGGGPCRSCAQVNFRDRLAETAWCCDAYAFVCFTGQDSARARTDGTPQQLPSLEQVADVPLSQLSKQIEELMKEFFRKRRVCKTLQRERERLKKRRVCLSFRDRDRERERESESESMRDKALAREKRHTRK